jgi:hypothetical protein
LNVISSDNTSKFFLNVFKVISLATFQPPSIKIAPTTASKAPSRIEFFLSFDKLAVPFESFMIFSRESSSRFCG